VTPHCNDRGQQVDRGLEARPTTRLPSSSKRPARASSAAQMSITTGHETGRPAALRRRVAKDDITPRLRVARRGRLGARTGEALTIRPIERTHLELQRSSSSSARSSPPVRSSGRPERHFNVVTRPCPRARERIHDWKRASRCPAASSSPAEPRRRSPRLARTLVRRAERRTVSLQREGGLETRVLRTSIDARTALHACAGSGAGRHRRLGRTARRELTGKPVVRELGGTSRACGEARAPSARRSRR